MQIGLVYDALSSGKLDVAVGYSEWAYFSIRFKSVGR